MENNKFKLIKRIRTIEVKEYSKDYLIGCEISYRPNWDLSFDGKISSDFKIIWDDGTKDTDLNSEDGLKILAYCEVI